MDFKEKEMNLELKERIQNIIKKRKRKAAQKEKKAALNVF